MSNAQNTHYEVLGVDPTATRDDIKKRYRELARRYHPDVAPTADAATLFRKISEANRVLSDPDMRTLYDAELKLRAARVQIPIQTPAYSPPNSPQPAQQSAAGFSPRPAPSPQAPRKTATPRAERPPEAEEFLNEARKAFARLRYREAHGLCRSALRLDPRNSQGYELLGDIQLRRGNDDEALAMYSYAIQVDRNNRSAQVKLDKMTGKPSGATMAGTAARAAAASHFPTPVRGRNAIDKGAGRILLFTGCALTLFMAYIVRTTPEPTAHNAWVFQWDPLLVIALAVSGLATGLMLSANGWVKRASEILGAGAPRSRRRKLVVTLGFALAVTSLILFHGSALLYLIVGPAAGRISRSLMAGYAATYALIFLFAFAADVAGTYVLLFGGNVAFSCVLAGWYLGDKLRGPN